MRTGSFFGVGLLPVLYCGGLVYYFVDFSGSLREAEALGLGPTVLGLGAIGLVTSIPLIMKVVRMAARRPPPPDDPGGDSVDADAAIARYKARQDPEPHEPPARQSGRNPTGTSPRPTFGRR